MLKKCGEVSNHTEYVCEWNKIKGQLTPMPKGYTVLTPSKIVSVEVLPGVKVQQNSPPKEVGFDGFESVFYITENSIIAPPRYIELCITEDKKVVYLQPAREYNVHKNDVDLYVHYKTNTNYHARGIPHANCYADGKIDYCVGTHQHKFNNFVDEILYKEYNQNISHQITDGGVDIDKLDSNGLLVTNRSQMCDSIKTVKALITDLDEIDTIDEGFLIKEDKNETQS